MTQPPLDDFGKEPLTHIRRPNLPWRDDELTECGKPIGDIKGSVLNRESAAVQLRRLGQQRFAMFHCMTCWNTARYNHGWDRSPSHVMAREVQRGGRFTMNEVNQRMDAELRAIAALIEAHREEFDGFLAGLEETTDLTRVRAAKRAKRR